jgi:sugar phosphate isomerase/epimerase
MGFAKVELNHQINSAMLSGIELDHYQFSSVHEPCPADISTEMLKARDWLVSSPDEECRRQGVASIKRSIDLAKELGAGVVVMHSGSIQVDGSLENNLRALFEAGQVHSQRYLEIKRRLADVRAARSSVCLESVKKSLLELLDYAGCSGIRLGLENRYHYFDIPNPDEMGVLLSLAGPEQLGFVYDVGHAQALDRLGFYPHEEWLKRYASRMIGVHLHDVIGIADHYAPALGEVDFDMVATYLPEDAFRTCEFQVVNTTEQVKAGLKILAEHGCIKCL